VSAELRRIDVQEPQFSNSISCSLGNIVLRLLNTDEDRPGSIKVELGTSQIDLHEFAERGARSPDGSFPAVVYALLFDLTVLLVGLFSIYSIDRNGKLVKLLDLFRSSRDDAGFFQTPELLLAGDWVLLKYETGIACFDLKGALNWHQKLHYDDMFESFDSANIWFSNEHVNNGRARAISLDDGKLG
jgi:hypothetical protein